MSRERIIIEFAEYEYNWRPVDETTELKKAISAGDYNTVAKYLKVKKATNIWVETKDAGWRRI